MCRQHQYVSFLAFPGRFCGAPTNSEDLRRHSTAIPLSTFRKPSSEQPYACTAPRDSIETLRHILGPTRTAAEATPAKPHATDITLAETHRIPHPTSERPHLDSGCIRIALAGSYQTQSGRLRFYSRRPSILGIPRHAVAFIGNPFLAVSKRLPPVAHQ